MYDVIIIGAGTAGLTAAIYTQRAGKTALLLEAKAYGGQIVNTPDIENYPGYKHISGFEFATNLYEQAKELGAQLKYERALSIRDGGKEKKTVVTNAGEYECKAVILATGAKNRPLGLENEQKMIGSGVSYCATCDGMFFRGREVAVVGGGNTAIEDASFLSNYCSKVYLIHRRDAFRGDAKGVKALKEKDNVEFVLNSAVTKLLGKFRLEGIEVTNKLDGSVKTIPVAGLFVAVGQQPENESFSDVVSLDEGGYIAAGEDCRTGTEGIFTAGDCRTKTVRQLTTAAADGAVAALAACKS
ncbi:MAG: thioredoxin-disulfide reductase [Clostridia bacterium]|nr:thioredoxin-disulfide reductase [Clostridia bacterium]